MPVTDPKDDLKRYLQIARETLLWKLEGLSEYDIRRPLVPSGTNLLGIVKHLASVELGYFGEPFGRRADEHLPWFEEGAEPNDDMWAEPSESREEITSLYRRAWAHADATIDALPLDALGNVPWWPPEHREVSLHRVLVHMLAETNRHDGHADIVRELIDGQIGHRQDTLNTAPADDPSWEGYRAKVEQAARHAQEE